MTDHTYLEDLVEQLAAAGPRAVVRCDGQDTSGAELLDAVHRYAHVLDDVGIGRGDLVAMYAPNRPEALALRYATHLVGAGSVYLSAQPDAGRRVLLLTDLDPQLIVVFPETAHLLPPTPARVGAIGEVPGMAFRLDQLAATAAADPLTSRARPGDLAVIISSGGTTGVPKGSVRDFATWAVMVAGPRRPERRQLANGKLPGQRLALALKIDASGKALELAAARVTAAEVGDGLAEACARGDGRHLVLIVGCVVVRIFAARDLCRGERIAGKGGGDQRFVHGFGHYLGDLLSS